MLMKLTTGVNLINILGAAFERANFVKARPFYMRLTHIPFGQDFSRQQSVKRIGVNFNNIQ